MTSQVNPEMMLYMNTSTGELTIEGVSCDCVPDAACDDNLKEFCTGLPYDADAVAKIRAGLNKKGVRVAGRKVKCVNISKDWLVEMLGIVYFALDRSNPDRLALMKDIAEKNPGWVCNPGIEVQRLKDQEYWDKVEQYENEHRAKADSAQPGQSKRNGLKILIVDDDMMSRRILSSFLSALGECHFADNGLGAVRLFAEAVNKRDCYDLVTLDIMLPEIDGHAVLQRIRNIEEEHKGQAARIIMTTSMNNVKVIMSAFKEQCDGYLVKPVRKTDLMKLLCEFNLIANTSP